MHKFLHVFGIVTVLLAMTAGMSGQTGDIISSDAKIREAQLQKIPYMLVVGDREVKNGAVAVRTRGNEDRGAMPLEQFKEHALALIQAKSMSL